MWYFYFPCINQFIFRLFYIYFNQSKHLHILSQIIYKAYNKK